MRSIARSAVRGLCHREKVRGCFSVTTSLISVFQCDPDLCGNFVAATLSERTALPLRTWSAQAEAAKTSVI